MADDTSLQDKILANAKKEPVQKLASNQGLMAAPITSAGTGAIGGTFDQAKMAGTPAQKGAALKGVIAAPKGETELEKAQAVTTATETAADVAKKEEAKKYLQSLGTYGAKVSEWIDAAKETLTKEAATVQVDVSDQLLVGLPAGDKEKAISLIRQIATETDNQKRLDLELELNTVLKKDINSVLNQEQKQELYQDVASSITTATEAGRGKVIGADRALTLSDISSLGTTLPELSSLLSVSEDDLGKMTIKQLQEKLNEVSQQQFGTTQRIAAARSTSLLSPAEREALRGYLRDVETVGVAGAEASVVGLLDQIDRDSTVSFAGKEYTVDQLLGTDAISKILVEATKDLKSAEKTGPTLAALQQQEPALHKWLLENVEGVNKLIAQSGETSKTFGEIQQENKKTIGVISDYDPELATKFGYDPTQLRSTKLDVSTMPQIFRSVKDVPTEKVKDYIANLSLLTDEIGPEQITKLNKEQVDKLDLSNPSGLHNQYRNAVQDSTQFQATNNVDEVIKTVSSGDESIDQLNAELTGDNLAIALGLSPGNISELDVYKDGVIDEKDIAGIKEKYKGNVPSLADFINGARPTSPTNIFTLSRPKSDNPLLNNAFTTLLPLIKDKQVDENEQKIIKQMTLPLNESDLQALANKDWSKVPGGGTIQGVVQETLRDKITKRIQEEEQKKREEKEEAKEEEKKKKDKSWLQKGGEKAVEKAGGFVKEAGEFVTGAGKAGGELVTQAGKALKSGFRR